jgi:cytochrome P450
LTDGQTSFKYCPLKFHIIVPLNRHQCFAGTVSVSGPKWKLHRKLFTPAFHFKILEEFVEVFGSTDRILIEKLERHVNGPGFDIYPYISLYTLDIICGKHNVSLVTGAHHVLWHIIMK